MDRRRVARNVALLLLAVGVAYLVVNPPLWLVPVGEYDTTTVTAVDADGTELATVDVRIADTDKKRHVGLSETDSLAPDAGMLFVFDGDGPHSFYMPKEMAFPLDIVFVAGNGTVTAIHHAPLPADVPEGTDARYVGRGRYVLEVNMGWTNTTGLDVGDRIEVPATAG